MVVRVIGTEGGGRLELPRSEEDAGFGCHCCDCLKGEGMCSEVSMEVVSTPRRGWDFFWQG